MITKTLEYLRRNAIALTALVCSLLALAGGTYAAVSLPNGSVGPAQLNHRQIGGYVKAWATVNASFQIISSSGGARVLSSPPSGPVTVAWPGRFPRSQNACSALATTRSLTAAAPLVAIYVGRGRVQINTSDGSSPPGISVALVC